MVNLKIFWDKDHRVLCNLLRTFLKLYEGLHDVWLVLIEFIKYYSYVPGVLNSL